MFALSSTFDMVNISSILCDAAAVSVVAGESDCEMASVMTASDPLALEKMSITVPPPPKRGLCTSLIERLLPSVHNYWQILTRRSRRVVIGGAEVMRRLDTICSVCWGRKGGLITSG